MNRPAMALALPVLLGGCTTLYPPLYSSPLVAAKASDQDADLTLDCRQNVDPLNQTIACAEILQSVYSSGYENSAQWRDFSQLPIIGAAAAAAWILLKGKDNAARTAGKIGIGALTYSATRDHLVPSGLPDVFIKGHGALGCVIAQGEYFNGDPAGEYSETLRDELANAYLLRVAVQKLRYLDPTPGDKSATPEMLAAARTLADQSITLSAAQLEASQTQLGAYEFANAPFRKAVTDIAAWVASRGRTRPNPSYDTLLGTFKVKPTGKGLVTLHSDEPQSAEALAERRLLADSEETGWKGSALVERLATASSILTNAAIRLKGATPDYKARLDAVAKCATDLPST